MRADPGPIVRARLDSTIARLAAEFDGTFSVETIERYVEESFDELSQRATVLNFLPLLTERYCRERLSALTIAQAGDHPPQVLFVCTHNAGRSQMAAAMLRATAGDRVGIWSAGTAPAEQVEPVVVEALDEIGLSAAGAFPKPLSPEVIGAADVVITMGCGDACPIVDGKRYEDWPVPDPASLDLAGVRAVRDDVARRVRALVDELLTDTPPPSLRTLP